MNMKKMQKAAVIALIIILAVSGVIAGREFIFSNIMDFRIILFSSDFQSQLFLLLLYAVIPAVPAVILRAKFGLSAVMRIALAATVLGVICCIIHIALPESILNKTVVVYEDASVVIYDYVNDWIFIVTQNILASSVPVLYCVAFAGKKSREIFAALAPSVLFFFSLCIRYAIVNNIFDLFRFIFEESVLMLLLLSAGFAVWAALLIFISVMVYKLINRIQSASSDQ